MNLLEPLRAFLKTQTVQVYLVGGVVRDMQLDRETHDLDVSVQGSASNLARAFADQIGAAYFLMDETFDVARVILDRDRTRDLVDFARLRGETVEQDLATRDFTINAIAADARTWQGDPSQVIDPYNGHADVQARRVRAVSDQIFKNDPVRLMRAARMEAELDFVLDDMTQNLVKRDANLIEGAPMERVRDELIRIIGAPHALRNLRRLDELGLLGRVLPELNAMRGVTQSPPHIYDVFEHTLHAAASAEETERAGYLNLAQGAFGKQLQEHFSQSVSADRTRRQLLRLALLLHDIGKPATRAVEPGGRIRYIGHEARGAELAGPALRRLKFSNDEIEVLTTIIRHHLRPLLLAQSGASDRAIFRFFQATGSAGVDIAVHSWCDQNATYGQGVETEETTALQAVIGRLLDRYYHAHTQVVTPPTLLTGSEVIQALHISPGRRVGELLDALREAQAGGDVTTREQAFEFIKKFDPPA